MHMKKLVFFEDEMAKVKLLSLEDPVAIKKHPIVGYSSSEWSHVQEKIMEHGLALKFTQDTDLKKILMDTGQKCLIEASPHDKYWGIGLGLSSKDLLQKEKWGRNRLGELLMIQRSKMRE